MHAPQALIDLMSDSRVSDIAINGHGRCSVKLDGRWLPVQVGFSSEPELRQFAFELAESQNVSISFRTPLASFVWQNWRLSAVLPFEVATETNLVFRRIAERTGQVLRFSDENSIIKLRVIENQMDARQSVLIAGPAGAGKTTLLAHLLTRYPDQRIVTIEDVAELNLASSNVVSLVARPANSDGFGEVSLQQLLTHSLRMSPDRIALGEVRSLELIAMFDALNTGHTGAGATIHANSLEDVGSRIDSLGLRAGLPLSAIARLAISAIGLVVFVTADKGHQIQSLGRFRSTSQGLEVVPLE